MPAPSALPRPRPCAADRLHRAPMPPARPPRPSACQVRPSSSSLGRASPCSGLVDVALPLSSIVPWSSRRDFAVRRHVLVVDLAGPAASTPPSLLHVGILPHRASTLLRHRTPWSGRRSSPTSPSAALKPAARTSPLLFRSSTSLHLALLPAASAHRCGLLFPSRRALSASAPRCATMVVPCRRAPSAPTPSHTARLDPCSSCRCASPTSVVPTHTGSMASPPPYMSFTSPTAPVTVRALLHNG
jgi:hypothetical protein